MVLNQTLEVRRKERKQNNLGEKKEVKLYVNYFSLISTFTCAILPTLIFSKVCDTRITTMLHKSL